MTLYQILLAYEKAANKKVPGKSPLLDKIINDPSDPKNAELKNLLMQNVNTDFNIYDENNYSFRFSQCYQETNFSESFKSDLWDTKFVESFSFKATVAIDKFYNKICSPWVSAEVKMADISDSVNGAMKEIKNFVQQAVAKDSEENADKIFQDICRMSDEDIANPTTAINLNPVIYAMENRSTLFKNPDNEKKLLFCLRNIIAFSPNANTVKQAQNLFDNYTI